MQLRDSRSNHSLTVVAPLASLTDEACINRGADPLIRCRPPGRLVAGGMNLVFRDECESRGTRADQGVCPTNSAAPSGSGLTFGGRFGQILVGFVLFACVACAAELPYFSVLSEDAGAWPQILA